MKATTATHLDAADMLAVLTAMGAHEPQCQRCGDVGHAEHDHLTLAATWAGVAPEDPRIDTPPPAMTDRDADVRAGVEEDRRWRSLP